MAYYCTFAKIVPYYIFRKLAFRNPANAFHKRGIRNERTKGDAVDERP